MAGQVPDPDVRGYFSTEIQVRFSDTDALGHINNASYAAYAETARLDFLARFGIGVSSIILAQLAIEYKKQILLGDPVSVRTRAVFLGNTSLTLEQYIVSREHIAARIRSVVVFFDYAAGRKRAIPTDFRARLMGSPDFALSGIDSSEADQSDGYR